MMHEFSLYGQVASDSHYVMLQQLAGVARMQPKHVRELHLVFKSNVPPGLRLLPSATNSDRIQNPEVQRVSKMLNNSLHYVQLVGSIKDEYTRQIDGDVEMSNGAKHQASDRELQWRLEFKDTPEPGKQAVTSRQVSTIPIEDGDVMTFMKVFGFEYVSRHLIEGAKFYDQETTLFLHRASRVPAAEQERATNTSFLEKPGDLNFVDESGGYMLQASIEAVDGTSAELKDRATRQLTAMKEILKQAVDLVPGDRNALDTKVKVRAR